MRRAGYEVAVLAPRGSVITFSRFIHRKMEFQPGVPSRDLVKSIWRTVVEWGASTVVPVDDDAIRFMHDFGEAVYAGGFDASPGKDRFVAMLEKSFPPREHLGAICGKRACHLAAVAVGIPTPKQAIVQSLKEASDFGSEHGYPLVLKLDRSSGGRGTAICQDQPSLHAAFDRLQQACVQRPGNMLLVESHIPGPQLAHRFVARGGKILAGVTRKSLLCYPDALGAGSVVEIVEAPRVAEYAAGFAAHFGYSGFGEFQVLLDERSGTPTFLEFNPMPVPMVHMDESTLGVDFCRAWHAADAGEPIPTFRGPIVGRKIALFPQEWLRDSNSRYLSADHAVQDVPRDDPAVVEQFLSWKPGS